MKQKILFTFLALLLGHYANAQIVNIPDANFKAALLAHSPKIDTDNDGKIQISEAQAYTGAIKCSNKSITDLTGIEAFTKITALYCQSNQLTNLDVSKNTALKILSCAGNQLTSLNLKNGNNSIIIDFDATGNPSLSCIQIDNIDLASLYTLWYNWQIDATASYNTDCRPVVNIPDANFKAALLAHSPKIDTDDDGKIQISEAEAFTGSIRVNNKGIADLTGIEAFTKISELFCPLNQLTNLDVSKNTALLSLNCHSNQLTSLNLKNGKNNRLNSLIANGNPNLSCIQVDDIDLANNYTSFGNWNIGATASFSIDCRQVVNIPDANFKAALLAHNPRIDTDRDGKIQVSEAEAFTEFINCANKGIANLTGIEAFTKIIGLYCNNNNLTNLDVSQNIALKTLNCSNNQLAHLDISKNTTLQILECNNNQLKNLDIRQNIALQTLYCYSNQLTQLDVHQNTDLKTLYCYSNQLTDLDVRQNTVLQTLYCYGNQLTHLDISKNRALIRLDCRSNQLTALNLKNGNHPHFTRMYAQNNPSLSCIEVDNVSNANDADDWLKDRTASYNENCNPVLPVTLVYFTATADGSHAKLQWETAHEVNNKDFEIYREGAERLEEGGVEGFVKIGMVAATTTKNYTFYDYAPLNGKNYYKLVQVDNDGKTTELGIRIINFGITTSGVGLYPNPTTDWVEVDLRGKAFTQLSVFDMNGKQLFQKSINLNEVSKRLSLKDFTSGIYLIRLQGKTTTETVRVIKR